MTRFSAYATLEDLASRQPNTDALVGDDFRLSYAEVFEVFAATAGWLLANGLKPGQLTGISIREEIAHLVCAMALLLLGTPHVNLPSYEPDQNRRDLARKLKVARLIAEQPEKWMDGFAVLVPPVRALAKAPLPSPGYAAIQMREGQPLEAVGLYQNTSGSTRAPRTFGLSLERLKMIADRLAGTPSERRVLRTSTMEYGATRVHRICTLLAGNTCVFVRRLNLRTLGQYCERTAVSQIDIGAHKLAGLFHEETRDVPRLPEFTRIMSGGTRVPGALRKTIKARLSADLWISYATSEVGPISLATPDEHEAYPEGVGLPLPEVSVEILDADGRPSRPGDVGQIRVRKRGTPPGYDGEQAASSPFRDGWFYPGDLISQTEDGHLIYHGRNDDVMLLNGIKVFPSAIEDVLESHPDVREAMAYAVKSRAHGEIPVASVVLREGERAGASIPYLVDYCRKMLGVRAPRQVIAVAEIPRTPAGKPMRARPPDDTH